MLKQSFDFKSLKSCLRRKDFRSPDLPSAKKELDETIHEYVKKINKEDYSPTPFHFCHIKRKKTYTPSQIEDSLVLRHSNTILKRVYKVKQADRSLIVNQIKSLVSESTPYSIIKTDIKNFYESIPPKGIVQKIQSDNIISAKICATLNNIFSPDENYNGQGLRRGLGISATLSEIFMRKFDHSVRTDDGVFFYARYVDDIVIFTTENPRKLINQIKDNLPKELSINHQKTKIIYVPCKNRMSSYCDNFKKCPDDDSCKQKQKRLDFLGYRLIFDCHKKSDGKCKKVKIRIAPQKVKKIKTRITRSFISFLELGDFELLYKRLQYLTGNYRLESPTRSNYLMSGIYYNYPLLTEPYKDLDDLDQFLKKIIFSGNNSFWRNMKLTNKQKKILNKFSFVVGYQKRISQKFRTKEIHKINECWQYE